MIRVTLHSRGDQITGFECRGHAGFDRAGRDIVCAAVSVLTTTCVNALETVAGVRPEATAKAVPAASTRSRTAPKPSGTLLVR